MSSFVVVQFFILALNLSHTLIYITVKIVIFVTQRRSVCEELWMFSAASVCGWLCLIVCQHDNCRTSKHRMMKLGAGWVHCTKISAEFECGGHAPRMRTPKNVAFGYDVGKISAGCLVFALNLSHILSFTCHLCLVNNLIHQARWFGISNCLPFVSLFMSQRAVVR